MTIFGRAFALVASFFVIIYGLLTTNNQAATTWLALLAIAFALLTLAFWPRLPKAMAPTERAIIRCTVLFSTAFLIISVQLVRVQVVDSAEISNQAAYEEGNRVIQDPRQRLAAAEVVRGSILTRDGAIVAETSQRTDGSFVRLYPDPATAYLAGYFSPLLYGSSNLEEAYDDYLMGTAGGNPVTEWLDGLLHRTKRGYNLSLSLDAELQKQADQLLGDRRGSVVVMDAKSGAVRAMVSKPNFDPNRLSVNEGANVEEEIASATEYWNQLAQAAGSPLVLRPTQGLYVPGSIFKTITASAAIESGIYNADSVFRDEGALTVESRVIVEENRPDPNRVDYSLRDAYGYSLNVVFAQIGLQLGPDLLTEFSRKFGLEQSIPCDLLVNPSRIATDPNFLSNQVGLAETSFGQGQLQVTPLQMALTAAAVVNDGELMEPYLVERVTNASGDELSQHSPSVWKRAITSDTAATMRDLMVNSVQNGYASDAKIPGLVVGGKTGTAEVGEQEPHAWFVGFAGQGEPRYVVSVIVENGGAGSRAALPIGRELLKSAVERDAP